MEALKKVGGAEAAPGIQQSYEAASSAVLGAAKSLAAKCTVLAAATQQHARSARQVLVGSGPSYGTAKAWLLPFRDGRLKAGAGNAKR
jgi:hypothetical protein